MQKFCLIYSPDSKYNQKCHKRPSNLWAVSLALWNKVPQEIKETLNLNAVKHSCKKHCLKEIGKTKL